MLRWLIATLHLLALPLGLGAVWARSRALRGALSVDGLRRVFVADNLWGVAAVLWIGTGLLRAVLLKLDRLFQLERLHAFNRKFFPEWRRRRSEERRVGKECS